jgi:putative FmdB family regulatory protein
MFLYDIIYKKTYKKRKWRKIINMPIYEYECKKCGKIFEVYQRLSEKGEDIKCPVCGSEKPVKRVSSFASCGGGYGSNHGSSSSGSCGGGGGYSSGFG